jgi:hypothetical protein
MRSIEFNVDGADAVPYIAAILLALPVGKSGNSAKFDREGPEYTIAWRLRDGTLAWGVSFHPVEEDSDKPLYYRNPLSAARAVIDRKHNEDGSPEYPGARLTAS